MAAVIVLAIWFVMMGIGLACWPLTLIVERWANDILERQTGDTE